jgi:hypothetical protein
MPGCLQACLIYRSSTFPVHFFAYLYVSPLHELTICLSARLSSCLLVFLLAGTPACLSYLHVLVCIFSSLSASYSALLCLSLCLMQISMFVCFTSVWPSVHTVLQVFCLFAVCVSANSACFWVKLSAHVHCTCTYNCNVHVRRMGCRLVEFINQEISEERERSITWLLQWFLRHKQTMPIWNPVSEYQPRSSGRRFKNWVIVVFSSLRVIVNIVYTLQGTRHG